MIRKYLVDARDLLCMTHEDVAKEVEISRQYYGMIENGSRTPGVPLAKRIGRALKIEWTLFFDNEGNESLLPTNEASTA